MWTVAIAAHCSALLVGIGRRARQASVVARRNEGKLAKIDDWRKKEDCAQQGHLLDLKEQALLLWNEVDLLASQFVIAAAVLTKARREVLLSFCAT